MRTVILLFLFFIYQSNLKAQQWNLVWADEFSSSQINTTNWTYDLGGDGWGNNELQNYTNSNDNSTISNDNLLIIAKQQQINGNAYTSARLKTQGLQSWRYGKIEARIKLPMQKGLWPAFWMIGNNITSIGWPKCGEIDIMEHVNTENKVHGTIHWDNNGHNYYGGQTPANIEGQYHIYSIEWNPDSIKWLMNGIKYWSANIANNINNTEEFQNPFFIILNVAVGGNWPGSTDNTTVLPDTMFVDYVRVYQQFNNLNEKTILNNNFSVSPNPVQSVLNITSLNATIEYVSITNISGQEILSRKFTPNNKTESIDISHLTKGIYFAKVFDGTFFQNIKVVLE